MRIVDHRKEHAITFAASPSFLEQGARFNDEIHRLPNGNTTHTPKRLYCLNSFEGANKYQQALPGCWYGQNRHG